MADNTPDIDEEPAAVTAARNAAQHLTDVAVRSYWTAMKEADDPGLFAAALISFVKDGLESTLMYDAIDMQIGMDGPHWNTAVGISVPIADPEPERIDPNVLADAVADAVDHIVVIAPLHGWDNRVQFRQALVRKVRWDREN